MKPEKEKARSILHVAVGIPGQWEPTAEEIMQSIKTISNTDTSSPSPVTVLPHSFLKALLHTPRKLKKSWNTSGLFISLRSRRGRRDVRKHAQQLRKLEHDLQAGVIKP